MTVSAPKNSNRMLLAAILVLIVIIGVFGYLNSRGEKLPEGSIRVKAGTNVLGDITLNEVKKLPVVNKKMVIDSSSGFTKHKFTCTPLLGVMNHLDPQIAKRYHKLITRGTDNYTSVIKMEEVVSSNNVFLVYADNGKPLKGRTGQDTMRIVIINDMFGQRFTNYLVEIELE